MPINFPFSNTRPNNHLFHNQVDYRPTMRRNSLAVFLLMTLMLSSLTGCLGLLQARETIEGMREDVYQVSYPDKVDMAHTFTTITVQPYSNQTSFPVDEAVERIEIYFKVGMSGSDQISCIDEVLTSELRYVRAEVTTPSGISIWLQDVCEDVTPTVETLEPDPEFETGDWMLDVEARGWGENTIGAFQDNFIVVITVHRVCQQFPVEPPCDR
jgi:hypothetical protein